MEQMKLVKEIITLIKDHDSSACTFTHADATDEKKYVRMWGVIVASSDNDVIVDVKFMVKNGSVMHLSRQFSASKVDPIISQLFSVGDEVVSIFGGFVGKVTSYDYLRNEAICLSDKATKGDRIRYSYKIKHLALKPVVKEIVVKVKYDPRKDNPTISNGFVQIALNSYGNGDEVEIDLI